MNCRTIREHLSAYLDGELEAELAREVKLHLDSCAACREELESLKTLTGVLHALPRERAPEDIQRKVVSYVEEDVLLRKPAHGRWVAVARGVLTGLGAVAAALLVGLSAWIYFAPMDRAPSGGMVTEYTLAEKSVTDAERGEPVRTTPAAPGVARELFDKRSGRTSLEDTLRPAAEAAPRDAKVIERKSGIVGGTELVTAKPDATKGDLAAETRAQTVNGFTHGDAAGKEVALGYRAEPVAAPAKTPAPAPTAGPAAIPVPDFTAPTVQMGEVAQTKPAPRAPAEPELLDLELEDDDLAAARRHVITVARSLDIPSIDANGRVYYWSFTGAGGAGAEPNGGKAGEGYAETEKVTPKYESALKTDTVLRGKLYGGDELGRGRPAVVLVVEEDKLPGLVAKLAVPRPRTDLGVVLDQDQRRPEDRPAAERADRQTDLARTARGPREAQPEPAEAAKEKRREGEKDVTTQVLDELSRMEEEARSKTRGVDTGKRTELKAPTPTVTPGPGEKPKGEAEVAVKALEKEAVPAVPAQTPAPAKKGLVEGAAGQAPEKSKLVYLRIYLKQSRARSAPAAAPPSK